MAWNSNATDIFESRSRGQRERIRWAKLSPEERQRIYQRRREQQGRGWASDNPPRDKPDYYYREREILSWEEDVKVQAMVAEHPEGMTLYDVASVFGVTRERIRQIEESAIAKITDALGAWAGPRMTPKEQREMRRQERLRIARRVIERRGSVTIAEMCRAAGMPRGAARVFLRGAVERGDLRKVSPGSYALPGVAR